MPAIQYNEQPLTYQQQVERLRNQGMRIACRDEEVITELKKIGFQRFRDYAKYFISDNSYNGANYDHIVSIPRFDSVLRNQISISIEAIELSFREQFCNSLTLNHGAFAYRNESLFLDKIEFTNSQALINKALVQSKDKYISDMWVKYTIDSLPFWAVKEVTTFGLLSRLYQNLADKNTKKQIAAYYGVDDHTLTSWLGHLSILRNSVAHQERLWHKNFTIRPKISHIKPKALASEFVQDSHKLYNSIITIIYLEKKLDSYINSSFMQFVLKSDDWLLAGYGFPDDWQTRPIWQKDNP